MENKNEAQKKVNMFESLRQLNSIVSGKELSGVFVNIKSAKSTLDVFCKKIKEQMVKAEEVVQKPAPQPVIAKEVIVEAVAPKPVAQPSTTVVSAPAQTVSKPETMAQTTSQQNKTTYTPRSEFNNQNRPYQRQGNDNQNYQRRDNNNNANFASGSYQPRNNNGAPYQPRQNANGAPYQPRTNANGAPYQPRTNATGAPYQPRTNATGAPYQPRQNYQGRPNGAPYQGGAGRPNNFAPGSKPNHMTFTNNKPRPFVKVEPVVMPQQPKAILGGNKAKSKQQEVEKKGLNLKEKMRMGYISFENGSTEENDGVIKIRGKKVKETKQTQKEQISNVVITNDNLTVKILSEKFGVPAADIIKKLMLLGLMYNINSVIDYPTAELIAGEFNITLERNVEKTYEEQLTDLFDNKEEDNSGLQKRPPVVTVMGHVDHGKTSLLDYIKKSHVILGEAGGITQHIGAYSINVKNSDITFIDTPGHAAFSEMRQRGAKAADIAILIVAADDGVMPQTVEAIKHIKAAKAPMIVAVNKIDKPTANLERIKQQLTEHDVLIEEWGGDTILVPISAHTGEGIDKLLEMILLVSEMNEFKANPNANASGTCIESKVDTGRGIVATIIINDGTLKVGDYVVCGLASGRVRAMTNYKGESVKSAGPSMAVSVVGLNTVPNAGDLAYVVDERMAKNIVFERSNKLQIEKTQTTSGTSLETFLSQNADQEIKTYKVIVKADVQGTSEALKQTLEGIANEEVVVSVISCGVGIINETDILLAKASNAKIIGFNTKLDAKARQLADRNGVEVKMSKIIYEAADYIRGIIDGMKTPKFKEEISGKAEVRQLFKISALGVIAGCYILDGVVNKNASVRVMRGNEVIAQTTIETLQQQKDESKQVKAGFECGIKLKNFNDVKVGDIIVAFDQVRI